jgi:exodeoxyribonuclease VII small subunit
MKDSYQTLSAQLDDVLAKLQQPDIGVDEAVQLYEQGLKLIKQCESQLTVAENKIEKLKLQAGAAAGK